MPGDHSVEAYLRRRTTAELLQFLKDYREGRLTEPYCDDDMIPVYKELEWRAQNFDSELYPG